MPFLGFPDFFKKTLFNTLPRKKMVRGKVQMKRIENASSRQVTFSKRRNGLLKKAYELSVLCEAEVALIVFSQKGRLYEFSSSNMQKSIQRYLEATNERTASIEVQQNVQHLKHEAMLMEKKIELLENSYRKLSGHNLNTCSMDELQEIDNQLERSLVNIRSAKAQLFKDEIERLKQKETPLLEENRRLCEKIRLHQRNAVKKQSEIGSCSRSIHSSEVVTELFIGPPTTRTGS